MESLPNKLLISIAKLIISGEPVDVRDLTPFTTTCKRLRAVTATVATGVVEECKGQIQDCILWFVKLLYKVKARDALF